MSSRGVVMLAHRAIRWSHSQFPKTNTQCFKCQSEMKMCVSDFSTFLSSESYTSRLNGASFTPVRCYAVKKASKKKGSNVLASTSGLAEYIDVGDMMKQMKEEVENLKTDFVKTLSLRSAGSIEGLKVNFEGKEYELQQIAKMTRKGQQTIVIDMLSFPQMTKAVVDTLRTSALNINPQQEATTIFVPIPKVTKEHREILAKKAKSLFISCRDNIKQIQEKHIKELRDTSMGDSEKQSAYKHVRAIADDFVLQSEAIMKAKQDELLGK